MYSEDVVEQAKIAKLTLKLKRKREHILEELENSLQRLPGALFLDPSIQLHQQMGAASIVFTRYMLWIQIFICVIFFSRIQNY
jgi:hypothetical protein